MKTDIDLKAIGARIKAERVNQKLTQEALAEKIYVTSHFIYEIETGMKSMSMETLTLISEALGLSADYILFGKSKLVSENDSEFRKLMATFSDSKQKRFESIFQTILENLM